MKVRHLAIILLAASALSVSAPRFGGAASAATVHSARLQSHALAFDKTRFLLHLGVAYYAFHHFVYNPYKAGALNRSHKVNLVKGALALAFAYHEVKTAYGIAQGSHSKTLKVLVMPMNALANKFNSLKSAVRGGSVSAADLNATNVQAAAFQSAAGKSGYTFSDTATRACC